MLIVHGNTTEMIHPRLRSSILDRDYGTVVGY